MTAHAGTLLLAGNECEYWRLVEGGDDDRAHGNRAPKQVLANAERLGLTKDAAAQFKEQVDNHHAHSHAGGLAMALRMDLGPGGMIYFGGHFDTAKMQAYRLELGQRVAICKWAREVMLELRDRVASLPVAAKS